MICLPCDEAEPLEEDAQLGEDEHTRLGAIDRATLQELVDSLARHGYTDEAIDSMATTPGEGVLTSMRRFAKDLMV